MDLRALAGNAPLKAQLEQEVRRRGLGHAYILAGPPGAGKHTLARLLSAALVCSSRGEDLPCGHCSGCRKVFGGIHPDVVRVWDGERDINVAQIRALRADAYIRPNEARRKVYLLEEAQNLNDSAQNALLKLLEEGPPYAAFLFLTDNAGALLPTVRSRCEVLTLSPVTAEEAEGYLLGRFPDQDPARVRQAARRCEGLLGRAVTALEGNSAQDDPVPAAALALINALARGDELDLARQCIALETDRKAWDRDALSALLDECTLLCRDALVRSSGVEDDLDPQRRETAARLAAALSRPALLRAMELFRRLKEGCGFYLGAGHLLGWLCAALASLPASGGVPTTDKTR